jgi:hypothetical protein
LDAAEGVDDFDRANVRFEYGRGDDGAELSELLYRRYVVRPDRRRLFGMAASCREDHLGISFCERPRPKVFAFAEVAEGFDEQALLFI